MHEVWLDVVEDSGVVSDQQDAHAGGSLHAVHAFRDDLQCVNIEARVGLVKNGKLWLQKLHLQNLVTLLFATREAFVDVALGEGRIHLECVHRAAHFLNPTAKGWSLAVDCSLCGAKEVAHRNAWDLDWVLHRQEDAGACTLVNAHLEYVLTIEQNLALGYGVLWVASDRVSQGRLARTVRAHDGVGFARANH